MKVANTSASRTAAYQPITTREVVVPNMYGCHYSCGKAFSPDRWMGVIDTYTTIIKETGKCSARTLAKGAKISRGSASKAIEYHRLGTVPTECQRGHGQKGVGSIIGLSPFHHRYIYDLYKQNPARPVSGYIEEIKKEYGIILGKDIIQRWFRETGPYKGSMRATSRFPSGRYKPRTVEKLKEYLTFISMTRDHNRLVFADEKPMKETNIYRNVRRDPMTGLIPNHEMEANRKNRFNILAAVTLKKNGVRPVEYKVIEACTDAHVFLEFVMHLLEVGTLTQGDIFIVDNCTVHMQGVNCGLKDALLEHGVQMIALPPYHPDFNPTELVFNTLLQRLSAQRARYNSMDAYDFLDAIIIELSKFSHEDILSFYQKCGYSTV